MSRRRSNRKPATPASISPSDPSPTGTPPLPTQPGQSLSGDHVRIDPAENCPVVHANMVFLGHRHCGRWRVVFF